MPHNTDVSLHCMQTPKAIVVVLNNIFKEFDELADKFVDEIHKVETVGAVYMMCSGVTVPCDQHATACCKMARDMMKAIPSVRSAIAEDFNSLKRSSKNFQTHSIKDLTIRVGVNTGSLVAGICGRNNPRFKVSCRSSTSRLGGKNDRHREG